MSALHERLRFDTAKGQVLDDTRRYLLMRADVLMGLFGGLSLPARVEALRALGRSVALNGADSVRAYAAQPDVTPERLLQTMADSAASLGWGRWQFEGFSAEGLALQVANSPFAAAAPFGDGPACHAIAGMLEALGAALYGAPCSAEETHCAAQSPGHEAGPCRFSVHRAGAAAAATAYLDSFTAPLTASSTASPKGPS